MVGVTITAFLAAATALVAAERGPRRVLGRRARAAAIAAGLALSVFATWSLVANQALFAGREALARRDLAAAREHGRRAGRLLVWSAEPELVLGDAAAGLGDRQAALRSYRKATEIDPRSWVAWLRLAQVARGPERAAAYRTVRELNPLEEGLPGE
jgi:tetratricopeptide (TPR) repeat protein